MMRKVQLDLSNNAGRYRGLDHVALAEALVSWAEKPSIALTWQTKARACNKLKRWWYTLIHWPAGDISVNEELLESLLHQPEGTFLDFKEAQYRFVGASTTDKSELLKDVLAFANSWRLTPAYVLIGVREIKGGRSQVVGVVDHLEDADLHQFVNNKTQRPVDFSYERFRTDGVEIGIINIPLQERPIHARNAFGKVEAGAVYIRDGSSTRKATPDEVAKMGAQQSVEATPRLELCWADVDKRSAIPSPYHADTRFLSPSLPLETFRLPEQRAGVMYIIGPRPNPDFSSEVIGYAFLKACFVPLGLLLYNDSRTAAKRVRFVGSIPKAAGIVIKEYIDPLPSKEISDYLAPHILDPFNHSDEAKVILRELPDRWEVSVSFGDIRPSDSIYTDAPIWIGTAVSGAVELKGRLLADNLPDPIPCSLEVQFQVETRPMEHADVLPYLQD